MKRLSVIAAAILATAASAPVVFATTDPASAREWRDSDDMDSDLRDLLKDWIRTREDLRDFIVDLLRDRREMRSELRERIGNLRDRDDEQDGGMSRGRLRERLAERLAERRGERDGDCFFLTRSLRDEDGDFLIIVRRRVCRD